MAFTEDLTVFTADFGVAATLAGVAVRVNFDENTVGIFGGEVSSIGPSCLLPTTSVASRLPGQAFVVSALPAHLAHLAGTYTLREAQYEPPDGAFTRLVLEK